MPVKGEYTMRAQPRRRKESASKGDEPIFLKKTFDLISSCDSALAGWSRSGETFIIKDPERFASEVIPTYFKHSKFSSFVRQLNFYGFRKVKSAAALDDPSADSSQWWEFKHDSFLRDQPHLLSEIKRATHYSASPDQEVGALRSEVSTLQERILSMDEKINALTEMVEGLIREKAAARPSAAAAAAAAPGPAMYADPESAFSKKRKIYDIGLVREGSREGDVFNPNNMLRPSDVYGPPAAVKEEYTEQQQTAMMMMPPPLTVRQPSQDITQAIDFGRTMSTSSDGFFNSELLGGLDNATEFDFLDFEGLSVNTDNNSNGAYNAAAGAAGFGTTDEQCDAMLMSPTGSQHEGSDAGDGEGDAFDADDVEHTTAGASVPGDASAVEAATESVTDLAMSLSALPAAAQEQLAEGLLAIMKQSSVEGEAQADTADATAAEPALVSSAASTAAKVLQTLQAQQQQSKTAAQSAAAAAAPEIAMPLASAALGAFLTRFAHTQGSLLQAATTECHTAFTKAAPRSHTVAV